MSARRAAVRRERKEREKISKYNSSNGEMIRLAEQGKLEGRAIAFCSIANILYELYGFKRNRIESFLKECNKEATRFDNEGFRFVIQFYGDEISKKLNEIECFEKPKNLIDCVYINQRDIYIVSSLSIMFSVLNSKYGMALKKNGKGRLNKILDCFLLEFIKIQSEPGRYNVEFYKKKAKEKIGLNI